MTNEPMDDLERQLSEALRRKEPPEGFEDRLWGRLPRRRAGFLAGLSSRFQSFVLTPRLRWTAALAMAVVVLSAIEWRHEARERAAGQAAKAQLELALRITSEKLQKIQERVNAGNRDQ